MPHKCSHSSSKSEPHKLTLPQAWRRIRGVKRGFACALTLHFTVGVDFRAAS